MDPQKFGRYEIKAEIGRGGMATVYHAYDPRFEREVAIKVLPREMLHDVQFRTRFDREAKTIAMLEHPAIVPVYDFGEEEGQPYFVMRYMTGGSLADRMKNGPISIQEAARIFTRIAPALDEAHHKGIIHRDLKPGNILFDQFNEPYISDFGIAKLSEAQTQVTGSAIVGTPAYMSPEQAQGENIDGRSDIYGLGVILFELLSGQQPYHGDTPMSVVVKHITDPVPHILDVKPDLPPDIEVIVEKAMAKDRNERFQNVRSLAEALSTVASGKSLDSFDATVITAPKTVASPRPPVQTLQGTVIAHTPPPMTAPMGAEQLPAPAAPKKRTGLWIGLGAGAVVLCIAAVAILLVFRKDIPFLAALVPTQTPLPTRTLAPSPVIAPTDTKLVVVQPAASATSLSTAAPASTNTPVASPTVTLPPLPSLGGADLIAFLSNKDIWLINVDGTNLRQLTKDGAVKHALQWAPDGQSLFYISGKCIQFVTYPAGVVSQVACFNSADYLDAFRISPDGTQVAISLNHVVYVVPFDLAALKNAHTHVQLEHMKISLRYGGANMPPTKAVLWSSDGKKLTIDTLSPSGGKQIDLIVVLDISSCTSADPCPHGILPGAPQPAPTPTPSPADMPPLLDNFPGSRFTMSGYGTGGGQNTVIPSFDWDGQSLFTLNSIIRYQFGYLYTYNFDKKQTAVLTDPIGTSCCYTDARWSPDGSYVMFAYQDFTQGNNARTQLYYISYGSIGTGATYTPLPLPDTILNNPADHPEPALRPAK
ncbi:MAG TPA: protein kinase [Anaerolineales bacterium]|nr:protein kinase [Anaerolineales bacterium]